MEKLSDLLEMAKVSDIIATKKEKEDNKIVWALAIIGAIAAVAGIAFAVYKYQTLLFFGILHIASYLPSLML